MAQKGGWRAGLGHLITDNHCCWILYSSLRSSKSQYPAPFAVSTDGDEVHFFGQRGALGTRGMQFRIAVGAGSRQQRHDANLPSVSSIDVAPGWRGPA